eukprot:1280377-Prymnesium_polylepis.1
MAGLDSLPDELLSLLVSAFGHVELCRLSCTSTRHRRTVVCDERWAALHLLRWSAPPPDPAASPPRGGWRADYARRHLQDARVLPVLHGMSSRDTSAEAWHDLLRMGEEVYERVIEVIDSTQASKVNGQAWSALRALNQAAVRREWTRLREIATAGSGDVAVEEGALLLVRFYLDGDDLRTPYAKPREVAATLDSLSTRLSARLEEGADVLRVFE